MVLSFFLSTFVAKNMKYALIGFFCFACSLFTQAQKNDWYAPNGGIFTPQGNLHVLLVFVVFDDAPSANTNFRNHEQPMEGWQIQAGSRHRLPQEVDSLTGACPTILFAENDDFAALSQKIDYSFSKDFFLMSQGKFRLTGEVFSDTTGAPISVGIDASDCAWWSQTNRKAWEKMQQLNPRFDYSRFDRRRNNPQFRFNNSDTAQFPPDKVLDYVIFIYRFRRDWAQPPHWGIRDWAGAGGGVASTGLGVDTSASGYRIREGFTMCHRSGVFVHELAHTLYNMPHLFGANKVMGDFFYTPAIGWGATSQTPIVRTGMSAWERWYVDYIPLVAKIDSPKFGEEHDFILRDFVLTGDAACARLPFTEPAQYLWLEYRTGKHELDNHSWLGQTIGEDTIYSTATGLYAYISELPANKNEPISALSNKANCIRLLNANGHFDYALAEPDSAPLRNAWGNELFTWERGEANPISGLSPYYFYPFDKNKDGQINMNSNYNQGTFEGAMIARERSPLGEDINTYAAFGTYNEDFYRRKGLKNWRRSPALQAGDSLSMSTNPLISNHPRYVHKSGSLQPFLLLGMRLQVEAISGESQALRVRIKYGHTPIARSLRYCGRLELPNLSGDERADLEIMPRRVLRLARSGTPNTHLKGAKGDFVNPSTLTLQKGASLHLHPNSTLRIEDDSALKLPAGTSLRIDKGAKIIIEKGATLDIQDSSSLQKHKSAKIIYK